MVLVDTSVWIDFFNSKENEKVLQLKEAISNNEDIAIFGVILTEVLQGIKNKKEYELVEEIFESLSYLEMSKNIFIDAANIYRNLRKTGITIRKPVDCMIASVAMNYKIALIHNDKDFEPIEEKLNLIKY